jgi:PhoPQ-activated pathogenicity-related protein
MSTYMPIGRRTAPILLLALVFCGSGALAQTHHGGALASYVAKADPTYAWRIRARYQERGAEFLELTLESQTWRNVLWRHQLLLIKPDGVRNAEHGLLIIGGGRWREEYESQPPADALPDDVRIFTAIARRLRTVVAVVGQVPFQPLFELTEDRLIAYTFDQYLKTGDEEWPLLLPMVKSAVRAMDASQQAALAEWSMSLRSFTVLGGSKRGWTTWLTAAVDQRVTALVPAVIDALNMERHFPHQTEVWGAPSEEIRPYTDLNLDDVLGSPEGAALRAIVDPYSYRADIAQPKLVVLATNDHYFPVDSANLYWDALREPKYLLYLPNEQHSIDDYSSLVATLRAVHHAAASGTALPNLNWELAAQSDLRLCVQADRDASVRLWTANSDDGDFRDAVWTAGSWTRDDNPTFVLERPQQGYAAAFAEARFGGGRSAFTLSTTLAVLAPTAERDGPRSSGLMGVCKAQ